MSLKLWYEDENLDEILDQLIEAAENVEEIEFETWGTAQMFGTGEQDNDNICEIIKKILRKPNLNKITYVIEDGMEINGEFPQVVYQWALTTKLLEGRNLEGCTLCLFMFSFQ